MLALHDKEKSIAILQWIETALNEIDNISDIAKLDITFQRLDWHISCTSYLVGHRLTLADLVMYESLKRSKEWKQYQARYKKHVPHLDRYYSHLDGLSYIQTAANVLQSAVKKGCSTHDVVPPTVETEDADSSVIILPHAEMGKVVTRFPPEASG